ARKRCSAERAQAQTGNGARAAKDRDVAAARQFDQHRIGCPFRRVVAAERAPQPGRLDPHDRVALRIEAVAAAEGLDADGVALEPWATARQRRLDHIAQEAGQSRAGMKPGTGLYPR